MMRAVLSLAMLGLLVAAPSVAQSNPDPGPVGTPPGAERNRPDVPDPVIIEGPGQAPALTECGRMTSAIDQAEQSLRQAALAINASIGREPPSQALSRVALMDHWLARLNVQIDASVSTSCLDPPRIGQLRGAVAQYVFFAAQAREFAQRAPEAAPQPPTRVQRRREQNEQQRQEQQVQQSLLP